MKLLGLHDVAITHSTVVVSSQPCAHHRLSLLCCCDHGLQGVWLEFGKQVVERQLCSSIPCGARTLELPSTLDKPDDCRAFSNRLVDIKEAFSVRVSTSCALVMCFRCANWGATSFSKWQHRSTSRQPGARKQHSAGPRPCKESVVVCHFGSTQLLIRTRPSPDHICPCCVHHVQDGFCPVLQPLCDWVHKLDLDKLNPLIDPLYSYEANWLALPCSRLAVTL